ncbi:MAG: ABC transporter ATP-binding protein [Oscillospiraceae bacterium]
MAGITVSHLSFTYPQETVPALRDVSFSVEEGEFLTVIGPSGGGKSTLLRALKPALTPHGSFTGEISFFGEPLSALDARRQAAEIGFVLQKPDDQIVTDRVWHELAFGMESLGFATPVIRRRVAEMASFFGIEEWFSRPVEALSGGQKQLLNLASVMALQPRVLLLDEPTSQLDPIAAADFLNAVARIRRELGTTVILSEHRRKSCRCATACWRWSRPFWPTARRRRSAAPCARPIVPFISPCRRRYASAAPSARTSAP